ncbi:Glycosyltransferase [uncultured Gammaproteobacteria bacterium]
MKVLQVMMGRGNGGAETYFADAVLALHASGLEQVVVSHPSSIRYAELAKAGVRLKLRNRLAALWPWPSLMIRHIIAREKPDVIHCWMRRAASLVPASSIPTIGWFGGYYDPAHFSSCSHFIGVTRDIVQHMIAKGVPAERASVVHTFPNLHPEPPLDRRELATPHDAKVLLALSRLHPKKGLDTLIHALVDLPECVAWIAGDGPLENELQDLAGTCGVAERVRFLGWRTDRTALLRAADVCVLPSRYEPFGTVVVEAWAAGVPLVACAAAGPKAHVNDGVDGLVVPIDDVAALAAALRRVIDDSELRRSMIVAGRQTYLHGFTREASVRDLTAIYKRLAQ